MNISICLEGSVKDLITVPSAYNGTTGLVFVVAVITFVIAVRVRHALTSHVVLLLRTRVRFQSE